MARRTGTKGKKRKTPELKVKAPKGEAFVGAYDLGIRRVNVFASLTGGGGRFESAPKSGVGCIVVGIDNETWHDVAETLLHEAVEFAASDFGVRYKKVPTYSNSADGYLFVMTHPQLSEVVGRASWLVTKCLPDLRKVYKEHLRVTA